MFPRFWDSIIFWEFIVGFCCQRKLSLTLPTNLASNETLKSCDAVAIIWCGYKYFFYQIWLTLLWIQLIGTFLFLGCKSWLATLRKYQPIHVAFLWGVTSSGMVWFLSHNICGDISIQIVSILLFLYRHQSSQQHYNKFYLDVHSSI